MLEDYYTVADAAVKLGLQYKTLLARINRGTVKALRKGSRIILVHKDEVSRVKAASQ